MFRSNVQKASTFKLQASRSKYQKYLDCIEKCAVVRKWPQLFDKIKESSQAVFDMCYAFHENSLFVHALNYDNKYYGFHANDNLVTFKDYLGNCKQAYLFGDFNSFNKNSHRLLQDEEMGKGWFKIQFDINQYRLEEGSRIMVRVIDYNQKQYCFAPPSCYIVDQSCGIFRNNIPKIGHSHRHKITHLLSYTIDLSTMNLKTCLKFLQSQVNLLQCYNTIILKNLFSHNKKPLHKFVLSIEDADILQQIVQRLSCSHIKVVIQWSFDQLSLDQQKNPLERQYYKEIQGTKNSQFDLGNSNAISFFLGSISHYFKYYGIAGVHLTKVHKLYQQPNGPLIIKLINLLCERLRQDSITLASSKQFIPGLTFPILEGGLGFNFTYNFHQTVSLSQQHLDIYQIVKQIQSTSNCLSVDFESVGHSEYIYLVFVFMISKCGVFTRGPIGQLKQDIVKILKLRKQQQLFKEEGLIQRIDQECIVIRRGKNIIIFNFTNKSLSINLPEQKTNSVIFTKNENSVKAIGGILNIGGMNCVMLENQ